MPSSTYANSEMDSIGKNKDSSGVYFDADGNVKATTSKTFPAPTVTDDNIEACLQDIYGFLKDTFESFTEKAGELAVIYTEFGAGIVNKQLHGTDCLGQDRFTNVVVQFQSEYTEQNPFGHPVPSTPKWYMRSIEISPGIFKSVREYRLGLGDLQDIVKSAASKFLNELLDEKQTLEAEQARQIQSTMVSRAEEVAQVSETLGISPEDAAAYLLAGHTVKEAADKIAAWNLASPSSRRAIIARDALRLNEAKSRGEEFLLTSEYSAIKYEAKPVDDLYKGIRNAYEEKNATKAYIALVKESLSGEQASRAEGNQVLLKLQEFYMQSVNELDSEKYQIVETFNKPKIYFFDRRARVYQYTFAVENTGRLQRQTQTTEGGNLWRDLFKNTYDKYLRGTKSVENRVKAVIHYDEVTRVGYVLSCNMSMDSQNDNLAQVSITMFVEDEQQRNVFPAENRNLEKDEIRKSEAIAIAKTEDVHIQGKYKSGDVSQNISCPTIRNIGTTNKHSFNDKEAINITLVKILVDTPWSATAGEISNGYASITEFIVNVHGVDSGTGSATLEDLGIDPSGIYITQTDPGSSAIKKGIPFDVPRSGKNLFVVFDTTSKTIQDLQLLIPKEDIKLTYDIKISPQENEESIVSITGDIEVKAAALDIKVSAPGSAGAKEFRENNKTIVKMECNKAIEGTSDNAFAYIYTNEGKRIYKAKFEVQLYDIATKLPVAAPTLENSNSTLALKMSDVVGSLNSSGSENGTIIGFIKLTPKDATTITCEINLTAETASKSLVFSAESCLLSGSLEVGAATLNVALKFIRDKDVRDYKLLKVVTDSSDKNGGKIPKDLAIFEGSLVGLDAKLGLIFDKDPGNSISKEILFKKNGKSSDYKALAYIGQINGTMNIFTKWLNGITSGPGNGVFTKVDNADYPFENKGMAVQVVASNAVLLKKDVALSTYGLAVTEDVYIVTVQLSITANQTWKEVIRTTSAPKSGDGFGTFGLVKEITSSGTIAIAKTAMEANVNMYWKNTETTKIGLVY